MYLVFDVESIGLHGEGFAVGWELLGKDGVPQLAASYACDPALAKGGTVDRKWVSENVKIVRGYNCQSTRAVRDRFWTMWEYCRDRHKATLWAECCWPVETNFLSQCIRDLPSRKWRGPYPLHDIATLRLAAYLDPLAEESRTQRELPKHDPLADARQSGRLLIEALGRIRESS